MKELNLEDLDAVGGGVALHALGLTGGGAGSDVINSHLQQTGTGTTGIGSFMGDLMNAPIIGPAIGGLMHAFDGTDPNNNPVAGALSALSGIGQIVGQITPIIGQIAPIISAFTGGSNNNGPHGNV